MLRPTKRVIIDLWGIAMFLLLVGLSHPWIGAPTPFGGKPHTEASIVVLYTVALLVTGVALADLVRAIRSGGALIKTGKKSATVDLATDTWRWVGPINLREREGVWVSGKCLHSTSQVVTFTLALARTNAVNGTSPPSSEDMMSFELAWEAEAFPENTLIPTSPGEHMLGVRVAGEGCGDVRLRIVWTHARMTKGKRRTYD